MNKRELDISLLLEKLAKAESALALIAAPMRPDGTFNRDRVACQQLAQRTLDWMATKGDFA